jgi:hypothetical protein
MFSEAFPMRQRKNHALTRRYMNSAELSRDIPIEREVLMASVARMKVVIELRDVALQSLKERGK